MVEKKILDFCTLITFEHTVVGDNIKIMKTTFDFNFDLYQAFKQHGWDTHKHGNKENCL